MKRHKSILKDLMALLAVGVASSVLLGAAFDNIVLTKGQLIGDALSWAIDLADVDGDGDLDGLVANDRTGSILWINDGIGIFAAHEQRFPNAKAGKLADITGDGIPDVILANWTGPIGVWRNAGDGSFLAIQQNDSSTGILDIAVADLDADGDQDLFLARTGADVVLLNNGDGVFIDSGQRLGNGFSAEVELGDLDLDGDLDAVADGWDGEAHTWINDGAGTFTEGQVLTGPEWHVNGLALGDLDGDGDLDAVLVSSLYDLHEIWSNDGTGLLVDHGLRLDAPDGYGVAVGDLDEDGDLDIVMAVAGDPRIGIAIWRNEEGGFVRQDIDPEEVLGRDVALGDLDADGDLDVFCVFLEYANGFKPRPNRIWLNNLK